MLHLMNDDIFHTKTFQEWAAADVVAAASANNSHVIESSMFLYILSPRSQFYTFYLPMAINGIKTIVRVARVVVIFCYQKLASKFGLCMQKCGHSVHLGKLLHKFLWSTEKGNIYSQCSNGTFQPPCEISCNFFQRSNCVTDGVQLTWSNVRYLYVQTAKWHTIIATPFVPLTFGVI